MEIIAGPAPDDGTTGARLAAVAEYRRQCDAADRLHPRRTPPREPVRHS